VHVKYIASTSDLVFWVENFRCFTQISKKNWIQKLAGKIFFPAKNSPLFCKIKKPCTISFVNLLVY
jgi:hypothetical protein